MNQYIKIKAFAELIGISVRTLQYYDEINLLKPAYVNEYGHRFYDSDSFSQIFVIISLKDMGMNLSEIHQYVNHTHFDIRTFIEEETYRIETTIKDLQLRLIQLSSLHEQIKEHQSITPALLPLFSHMTGNTAISQVQINTLVKNEYKKPDFNIKDWNTFIKDLNFCFEKKLPANHKRAIKCIKYWKENILEANQVTDDMIKFAEAFYEKNHVNTFGITGSNYQYLIGLMNEYDAKI